MYDEEGRQYLQLKEMESLKYFMERLCLRGSYCVIPFQDLFIDEDNGDGAWRTANYSIFFTKLGKAAEIVFYHFYRFLDQLLLMNFNEANHEFFNTYYWMATYPFELIRDYQRAFFFNFSSSMEVYSATSTVMLFSGGIGYIFIFMCLWLNYVWYYIYLVALYIIYGILNWIPALILMVEGSTVDSIQFSQILLDAVYIGYLKDV